MKSREQLKTASSYARLLIFCFLALTTRAFSQDVKVDHTFDDCDQKNSLKVQGKSIPIGVTTRVAMPALTNEVIWFCDGDRNRSASDFFFNLVKIRRQSSTDEFKVTFFKSTPKPDSNQPDVVKVGTTKDGCDGSRHVRFKGKEGNVIVKAGKSSELVELSSSRNQIDWFCLPPSGTCPQDDVCDEHSANSQAFDFAQLERAGNGAMNWIFYRRKNGVQPGEPALPDFVRNANGNVRVVISTPLGQTSKPLPEHGLKLALDRGYLAALDLVRAFVRDELVKAGNEVGKKIGGKFRLEAPLQISGIQDNELRTAATGDEPSLKYLAHGNAAKITFTISGVEAQFNLTFDTEVEVGLQLNPLNKPPRAVTAEVRIGHTEIEGSNSIGNLVQEILKNKLREGKTRANNVVIDFRTEVNKFFDDNFPKIPAHVAKVGTSVTGAGTMRFCLRVLGAKDCVFIGEQETAHKPKVLDTEVDRCESGRIWLRDAAKRRYVSIAKGKNVIVEVDSREFPWFCGGSQGPEEDESATGPLGTYLVSVSRAPTGDRIDWKFMSWR